MNHTMKKEYTNQNKVKTNTIKTIKTKTNTKRNWISVKTGIFAGSVDSYGFTSCMVR